LRLPSFPRAEPLVASFRDVEGHVPELAAYYRDAFAALQSNNASASTLYWLRLVLSGGKPGTDIGFGWWDTLGEMRPFFRWIDEAADGQIFDDLDQGWRVQALRCGSELCFRHTDFDSEEELGRVRAPREACIAAADDAWARTQRIVEQLHRELGINPWA
jgi:hypothetical protein